MEYIQAFLESGVFAVISFIITIMTIRWLFFK